MMVLTFDSNLQASDGTDLQLRLPGFGRPSADYKQARFEHKPRQISIQISNWLPPRIVEVEQPLLFQQLWSVVRAELTTILTKAERRHLTECHERTYGQMPADMYKTRKDAFDPDEHPNWFFKKAKGSWLLQAGK